MKIWWRWGLASILAGVLCFMFSSPALAAERISLFESHLEVQPNTSLRITETIHYTTTQAKHGIYRYIPTRYTRNGINETAQISHITVTDQTGQPIQYDRSWDSGNVTLKIGDPDTTFTGDKTYVISYTVDNAVGLVPVPQDDTTQVPELYWDITGEGWTIEIASSTATLTAPAANIVRTTCYAGAFGSSAQNCQEQRLDEHTVQFSYDQPIAYGDNMTIVAQFDPAGGLIFPTPWQRLLKQLRDNLVFLPLILPAGVLLIWWWRKGRDQEFVSWNVFNHDPDRPTITTPLFSRRQAPFVYEPISDLTPGQAGALLDEKVDGEDVVSEIIDLARQKYLTIERHEKKRFLGTDTDYTFTKLKKDPAQLPAHQQYLLEKLFADGETVKMSDLKGDFYTHFEKTKQLIFDSLVEQKLFANHPHKTRVFGFGVAGVLLVPTGVWMFYLVDLGLFWALPVFGVSAALALFTAYFLPAKTASGRNYMWQAKGLQRMIRAGAWRQKINEKHLFFEEVLPFAIAFGVVDKLSKDMEDLDIKPPEYVPVGTARAFTTAHFVQSFTHQANSTLAYNPSSSSRGSGSGFSGGFSGGGGGGGGGGSW